MIPNSPISRPSTSIITYLSVLALSLTLCAPGNTEATLSSPNSVFDFETLIERSDTSELTYEPEFAAFDRSIIGRAPPEQPPIIPGGTICYIVDKKTLFGKDKRDDDHKTTGETAHQNSLFILQQQTRSSVQRQAITTSQILIPPGYRSTRAQLC
ncbi:hypothetical protein LB503_003140 [Fusarium chuoi]|nr:hypothetical protein LB503_003140 [Fusarium chuoi]